MNNEFFNVIIILVFWISCCYAPTHDLNLSSEPGKHDRMNANCNYSRVCMGDIVFIVDACRFHGSQKDA
jgi:hypothetical protein